MKYTLNNFSHQIRSDLKLEELQTHNLSKKIELCQILEIWKLQARSKIYELSPCQNQHYQAQHFVCDALAQEVRRQNGCKLIFVLKNSEDKLQAAMMIDPNETNLEIDYIVTSPENIEKMRQGDMARQRLGSHMIEVASMMAKTFRKSVIQLKPLESCVGFYKKMGFEYLESTVTHKMFKIVD